MQSEITENLQSEANDHLKRALQKNDIKEARIAQAMIDAAVTGKKNLKEKKNEVDGLVKKIEKKKDETIDNFLVPKTQERFIFSHYVVIGYFCLCALRLFQMIFFSLHYIC